MQVHCVKAAPQLLTLVRELGPFPAGLILHSFLGPPDLIKPFAAVDGVHFSLSGHCLRSASKAPALVSQVCFVGCVLAVPLYRACLCLVLRSLVRLAALQVPLDRLLLETDSPDARPHQHPELQQALPGDPDGRLNQPANVRWACCCVLVRRCLACLRAVCNAACVQGCCRGGCKAAARVTGDHLQRRP